MSNVIVELPATCDRTGKVDKISMTTNEAEQFQKLRDRKTEVAKAMLVDLAAVAPGDMPDLVVCFRGKIAITANVNPKSDDALARLLHEVTRDSAKFPKPPQKKRKAVDSAVKGNIEGI